MMRNIAVFSICVVTSTLLHAQDEPRRQFQAITIESPGICRAWLLPDDENLRRQRLMSRQIPASYVEELGLIHLTGRMRYKNAIAIEDLLESKQLDGLDLSYIGLRDDDLKRITRCQTLRHLYLSGIRLTGSMIDSIAKMDQLEYLNLNGSEISTAQLEMLATRLPNVKIETDGSGRLAAACDGYHHLELNK